MSNHHNYTQSDPNSNIFCHRATIQIMNTDVDATR